MADQIIPTLSGQVLNTTNNFLVDQKSIGTANGVAGLDASKQVPVGFLPASVVLTTDSRLSDARTPLANSVTTASIVNGSIVTDDLADGAVTLQKHATMKGNRILGRVNTDGIPQEIQLGSGFSIDATQVTPIINVVGGNTSTTGKLYQVIAFQVAQGACISGSVHGNFNENTFNYAPLNPASSTLSLASFRVYQFGTTTVATKYQLISDQGAVYGELIVPSGTNSSGTLNTFTVASAQSWSRGSLKIVDGNDQIKIEAYINVFE